MTETLTASWVLTSDSVDIGLARSIAITSDCRLWLAGGGPFRGSCSGAAPEQIGREGAGPGEFRHAWSVSVIRGDTVAVWDRLLGRVTILSGTGDYVRQRPLALTDNGGGRLHGLAAPLGSAGPLLVWANRYPRGDSRPEAQRAFVWRADTTGLRRDSLVFMEGPQSIVAAYSFGVSRLDAPFQRRPFVLFLPSGGFIVANSGRSSLDMYDAGGARIGAIELELPAPRQATDRDRRAYRDSIIESTEREMTQLEYGPALRDRFRAELQNVLRNVSFPATLPWYEQMVLGDDGATLWVLLPSTGRSYTRSWRILGLADGRVRRDVTVPHSANVIAGAVRDEALYTIEWTREGTPRIARYARR